MGLYFSSEQHFYTNFLRNAYMSNIYNNLLNNRCKVLRKFLTPLYEKILAYLTISGEKRLSEIADHFKIKRQSLLYHLRCLCREGYLNRIERKGGPRYQVSIENFLQYMIRLYGPISVNNLARKLFLLSNPEKEVTNAELRRVEEKLRRYLNDIVSKKMLTRDAHGRYCVVSLDDIVTRILREEMLSWRRTIMHGIEFIETWLEEERVLIKTYEGLYSRDIELLLNFSPKYVEKISIMDKLSASMYSQLRRILETLSLIVNEKLGLLNIISFAKEKNEKVLVVIGGDDISAMHPNIVSEANRKINIIAEKLRSLPPNAISRSPLATVNTHFLFDSIVRLKAIIRQAKTIPNIRLVFGRYNEELREKMKKALICLLRSM